MLCILFTTSTTILLPHSMRIVKNTMFTEENSQLTATAWFGPVPAPRDRPRGRSRGGNGTVGPAGHYGSGKSTPGPLPRTKRFGGPTAQIESPRRALAIRAAEGEIAEGLQQNDAKVNVYRV